MTPLISIIVPVYNNEKYIDKCVKSLLAQTYRNIEILLINDGSTDRSGEKCEALQQTDARIHTIHKTNAGVSAARNTGLDRMHGRYVTFVDSDDYVAADFIETLYHAISVHRADIATCGHYRVNFDGSLHRIYSIAKRDEDILCFSGIESLTNLFYGRICSASSGSKLYKIELFENLRFPALKMGEDTYIVYHTFLKAEKIAHTNKPLYFYVQHESSVTNHKSNYYKFYDYVRLYDHIVRSNPAENTAFYHAIANRLIENNFWVYMKLRNCPHLFTEEKKHIIDNIKKYRKYVITNSQSSLRVRAACLLSLSGMHVLDAVYDKINKK